MDMNGFFSKKRPGFEPRTLVCQPVARIGSENFLEDRSVQDLKIVKMTSKDLFLVQELLDLFLFFSKWLPWNFNDKPT